MSDETTAANAECDHCWTEGTNPDYFWCHKCGAYLKKWEPEPIIIYTPWVVIQEMDNGSNT